MTFQTQVHPLNWKNPKDIYEISIDFSEKSKDFPQDTEIKINKFSKDIIFDSIENHNISEDTIQCNLLDIQGKSLGIHTVHWSLID